MASYYDALVAGLGTSNPQVYGPQRLMGRNPRFAQTAAENVNYWPGLIPSDAAQVTYNPNYYRKLLAAGHSVDPRTGRSIIPGAGGTVQVNPGTTLNPFVNQQTGEAQTPYTPQNFDPGIDDVINSAGLSNDPEYQDNLGRALFSLSGGVQEIPYAEQRRAAAAQAFLLPQKRKDLAALVDAREKQKQQAASYVATQPGMPVEALNELMGQIDNQFEAKQALIMSSSVPGMADVIAAQESPEYNISQLTQHVTGKYGEAQGQIVKSLAASGSTPDVLVKYLSSLATNQATLQKTLVDQQMKASDSQLERLDLQLEQGLISESDYNRETMLQAHHRVFLLTGKMPPGVQTTPVTPMGVRNADSVTAARQNEFKQRAASNEMQFFSTPEEKDKALAAGTLKEGSQYIDGQGNVRTAKSQIPGSSAVKPATKSKMQPMEKRQIPIDVALKVIAEMSGGK